MSVGKRNSVFAFTVLGVRPNVHAFGYAFMRFGNTATLIDAGVLRSRAKWGKADQAASQQKQGRDLAGLLRIVAMREDVVAICAPSFAIDERRHKRELADDSRAWGQVDFLAEALRVPIVCVSNDDIDACHIDCVAHHSGAWMQKEEFAGERLKAFTLHAWCAIGATVAASSSGRLRDALKERAA